MQFNSLIFDGYGGSVDVRNVLLPLHAGAAYASYHQHQQPQYSQPSAPNYWAPAPTYRPPPPPPPRKVQVSYSEYNNFFVTLVISCCGNGDSLHCFIEMHSKNFR